MKRALMAGIGLLASVATLAGTAEIANAVTWVTDDTDNMALAVPSGKAFTSPASIAWRHEGGVQLYEDKNAHWTATLVLRGRGCARLRVVTYKKSPSATSDQTPVVSKRWPAAGTTSFGYYNLCGSSGARRSYEGGDTLSNRPGSQNVFQRVDWSVCYAPSSSTPCTQTVTLTRKPGD